ncbi:hypothetical protein Aduo_015716 [Ancylostoma duodenale]
MVSLRTGNGSKAITSIQSEYQDSQEDCKGLCYNHSRNFALAKSELVSSDSRACKGTTTRAIMFTTDSHKCADLSTPSIATEEFRSTGMEDVLGKGGAGPICHLLLDGQLGCEQ